MVATVSRGKGGRRRGRRARRASMSEINVTPFVDVILVVLIIFMVAAPLLSVGVEIELPETAANALPQPEEEPLTVQIAADGRVFVQNTEVPEADLLVRLTAIAGERAEANVYLRADRSVAYGRVMQVMGALNAGGFRSVGLVTDPLPPGGASP